jgi:hypothetical protein
MDALLLSIKITAHNKSNDHHQNSDHYKSDGPPGEPESTIGTIIMALTVVQTVELTLVFTIIIQEALLFQ